MRVLKTVIILPGTVLILIPCAMLWVSAVGGRIFSVRGTFTTFLLDQHTLGSTRSPSGVLDYQAVYCRR